MMPQLIAQIIEFIKGLLGMNTPALPKSRTYTGDEAKAALEASGMVKGAEHIDLGPGGSVTISEVDVEVLEKRDGAYLSKDPDDGETNWTSTVNLEVAPSAYPDDWGPLPQNQDRLATWCFHEYAYNMTVEEDPYGAEKKIQGYGYRDMGHFFKVRGTVIKHHGTADGASTLDEYILGDQAYMSASMKGARMYNEGVTSDVIAADPSIMEPVEGVSLEVYAKIAAFQAQGPSEAEFGAALAKHNIDHATFTRASTVWQDRMSKDTTASIATIYGKAFMGAGQGQFGAAAQAGAATNFDGSAAGGGAPIPYERACEIQGAMTAWSETGQDVNALLQAQFGMNAADWSAANMWWLTQLQADVSKFADWQARCDQYTAKYRGGAPARPDTDLTF